MASTEVAKTVQYGEIYSLVKQEVIRKVASRFSPDLDLTIKSSRLISIALISVVPLYSQPEKLMLHSWRDAAPSMAPHMHTDVGADQRANPRVFS